MTLKNPFETEENLKDWLEKDQFYLQSKQTDYLNFRKTTQQPGIFMSLQETYLKIVNSITKHSITATLIMLFALGSVGASAAELLAPTDYKPSTVAQKTFNSKNFESNQQKEKNPYTALKPDENNDVVISDKCDLAIKYPKNFDGKSLSVDRDYFNSERGLAGESTLDGEYLYIRPNQDPNLPYTYYSTPSLNCSTKASWKGYTDLEKVLNAGVYGKENKNLEAEFIKSEFGWFISEVKDLKYRIFENPNITGEYTIYFEFKDKVYFITTSNKTETTVDLPQKTLKSLKGNQIQIQFNSLVENQANAEIVDKPKTDEQKSSKNDLVLNNDTFEIQGAVPMKIGDDTLGGTLVKRLSTGKIYALSITVISKFYKELPAKVKTQLQLTGTADLAKNLDYAGEPVDFVVTKLDSAKIVESSISLTEPTTPTTGGGNQSYTNQYFPNFKLNYDDSWKFERKTKAYDINPNLLEGVYTLTKSNTQIKISVAPIRIPSGCGPIQTKAIKSGNFYRYQEGGNVIFGMSEDPSCILDNRIATNIKLSDVQYIQDPSYNYKQVAEDFYKNEKSSTVIYNYSINIESIESPDSTVLQEAENIIQNSVFK